eukprot:maker-scaffold103_size370364-snap-gene-2.27 protein:Tk07527 transcript:maker-scaffold103_size370364-snap-gene-2.27-mRNA-1 annotation:"fmrfamide receptor"
MNTTAMIEELNTDLDSLERDQREQEEWNIALITRIIEGYLLTSMGLIGLIGNTLAILVFSRQRVQKNFHALMVTLAVFDITYILVSIAVFALPQFSVWYKQSGLYYYLLPWILPLAQIGLTGSIYFTMAITLERYFTVCHPFFRVSHSWSAKVYIVPIVSFALLYNLPKFFELKTVLLPIGQDFNASGDVPEGTDPCVEISDFCTITIRPTALRLNRAYKTYYCGWINSILCGFVPFITLIGLNSLTLRSLIEISRDPTVTIEAHSGAQHPHNTRRKEINLAKISLVIVFVFIVCHVLKWIPNLYELILVDTTNLGNFRWPYLVEIFTNISHLFLVLNSSVNFYIYFAKHPSIMKGFLQCGRAENEEINYTNNHTIQTTTYFPTNDSLELAAIHPHNGHNRLESKRSAKIKKQWRTFLTP